MFRRQYKPAEKEREELGIFGRRLPTKPSELAADPNFVDDDNRTHLHIGVLKYCVDDCLFESALKAGCNVNAVDSSKSTCLHYAASKGLVSCVDKLIKKGARTDLLSGDEMTPLMLSARHGHPAVVKSLLKARANVNFVNDKGVMALHLSCSNGHLECTEILLKYKAKVNYPDNVGNTPLILASNLPKVEIVRALIGAGARVDKIDQMGRTALHWAVISNNKDVVDVLIEADATLDISDKNFVTAFVYAVVGNKVNVLKSLLGANCDRSTIDGLNGTAMSLAALKGHSECVRTLLEEGEDADEFSYFGMTALMASVYESHLATTDILLQYGAEPNIVSRTGFTALFAALCHISGNNVVTRHQLVVLLLKHGADVNFRVTSASVFTSITNGRNCPMSFAFGSGYTSLVRMFLQAGSDIQCTDLIDVTSKDSHVSIYNTTDIIDIIKQYRSQPVPLHQLCRLVIRRRLGSNPTKKMLLLPIAPGLKSYLNFADLTNIIPEQASTVRRVDSEYMVNFVDVRACGLSTLKGSLLYDNIQEPIMTRTNGMCDCDICQRIQAMKTNSG